RRPSRGASSAKNRLRAPPDDAGAAAVDSRGIRPIGCRSAQHHATRHRREEAMSWRTKLASGAALAAILGAGLLAQPARAADKTYTVGYSVATLANPFFQGMTKGVVDGIKKYPDLKLINTSANGDAN